MTVEARVAQAARDAGTTASRRPPALLWWALGLLAAFVVMAVAVAVAPEAPFTQGVDSWWRGLVGASPDGSAHLWAVPMFFQYLGEAPGALVTVILIPLALTAIGRWRSALFFLSAGLVGPGLFSQLTKNLVDRPRPALDEAAGLWGPLFTVDHGSFPSGHAVSAAAVAIGVAALIPSARKTARTIWWFIGGALMLGMMWQRTLINAHWLADTFFGLAAGAAGALLMWWAFWPLLQKDYGRPVWFMHRGERPSIQKAVS